MISRARATALTTILALMMPTLAISTAHAQTDEMHMLDLPVLVVSCDRDPGNKLQPGGGRFSPNQIMDEYGCDPLEDVSVTVSTDRDDDLDFVARCETDDDGLCRIEAPTSPERELMVAVHLSTVEPGLELTEPVTQTIHFSEFTGVGIVLQADKDALKAKTDELPERRTLAVKAERDGEPAEILTQLSEGDVSIERFPWLATNEDGWVSYDLGQFDAGTVDLMLDLEGEPVIACSDIDHSESLDVEWVEGREGDFARITLPETDGDINCDVALP